MIKPTVHPLKSLGATVLLAALCMPPAGAQPRLEPIGEVELSFGPVRAAVGSKQSQRVALTDRLLDVGVADGERLLWTRRMEHPVSGMAFHRHGEHGELLVLGIGGLMAGPDDMSIQLLDADTGRESWRVDGYGGPVASGGDTLVAAGGEGAARLRWSGDAFTLEPFARQPVETVAVSPDGRTIALVDFNATGGEAEGESPNYIRLFTVGEDGVVAGDVLRDHVHDIVSVVFTAPDTLVSADFRGTMRTWTLDSGESRILGTDYTPPQGDDHTSGLLSVSRDGRWIAGDFGPDTVLSLADGTPLDTRSMTARQGPGHTVFAGNDIALVVKPPTFPLPLVRWWKLDAPEAASVPVAAGNGADEGDWNLLDPGQRGLPAQVDSVDALVQAIEPEARPGDVTLEVTRDGNRHHVRLLVDNLMDDSMAALRYRIELREDHDRLHIDRLAEQVRCHPGRGSQEFSAAPCR